MLSSRLVLGAGTASLVAVATLGTVVLVGGARDLAEPSLSAPRPSFPSYQAPPLVVPRVPGAVVVRPPVRHPATPTVVVGPELPAAQEPPAVVEPRVAPPVPAPPVVEPPVVEPDDEPGRTPHRNNRGKHLGQLKHGRPVKG